MTATTALDLPSYSETRGHATNADPLSVSENVEKLLSRIARHNGEVHALIHVMAKEARARAHELDLQSPAERGRLHGMIISIKDTIDVAGATTTCASFSRVRSGRRTKDAALVAELRNEGAIIIGKANCHEFAFGGPAFDLPYPPARNPWDPNLFPGGSSSGSAVSVAAGFCHAAIGTDTAGSVRLPSSHCGLVGLKLTNGLVSLDGVEPLSQSLDSIGPFTRSVADAELIFETLVRPVGPGCDPEAGTIAVPDAEWLNSIGCDFDAAAVFDAARSAATEAGFEIREVSLPPLQDIHAATAIIMMREVANIYSASVRADFKTFGEVFRARALLGERISDRAYRAALLRCTKIADLFRETLADHAALLLPGHPSGPGPLTVVDKFYFLQRPNLNIVANATGMPVVSLPVLRDAARRPLGIQMMSGRYKERELLKVGKLLEDKFNYPHQHPF